MPEEKFIKTSINLSPVDAGYIDILVTKGLFASRTEFMNYAIKKELEHHELAIDGFVAEQEHQQATQHGGELLIGSYRYDDAEILKLFQQHLVYKQLIVVGLLNLTAVTDQAALFRQIQAIHVFGKFSASPTVLAHYRGRSV